MGLINCPECNNQISDAANACPRCGFPLRPQQQNFNQNVRITQQQPNRPTGQPMPLRSVGSSAQAQRGNGRNPSGNTIKLCKYCRAPIDKKTKVCPVCGRKLGGISISIVSFAVMAALFCIIVSNILRVASEPDKTTTVLQSIDATEEQQSTINIVLLSCGISDPKNIEHDEMLDNIDFEGETGYRIALNDSVDNIILYLDADKKVYSIRYADNDLYANNTVISTINDYTLTSTEMSDLQIRCQSLVEDVLKSPSTAKFPNILKWNFWKNKNLTTVQGYVDAENGFGAEIRSEFQIIINTDTNTVQSFIFDGQELIN